MPDKISIEEWAGRIWELIHGFLTPGGGNVNVNVTGGSLTVDGPLTDTQLRATAVPVSGPLTDTQLRATAVPVSLPAVASGTLISPTGGSKTVAATGTAEALVATTTKRSMLFVRAKAGNTNNVYFGDSAVDKTTSQQVVLDAGESVSVAAPAGCCIDVGQFYIDVDTNGEGVDFLYI